MSADSIIPMDPRKPSETGKNPANDPPEELAQNPEVDEFFRRLNSDLKHPRPGQDAITAAMQVMQRLALQEDIDHAVGAVATGGDDRICGACGSHNRADNRFCSLCGVALQEASAAPAEVPARSGDALQEPHASGQHHYHHHYHHHYFVHGEGGASPVSGASQAVPAPPMRETPRIRPSVPGGAPMSRAEVAVRKFTQDWVLACNTKHLDDLVGMYGSDAIVLRSNVAAVRGAAAIREFFFSVLDAGMGDLETEAMRVEVLGDFAYEAGRYTVLVPVSLNQRREERGKYLVLMNRQAGDWKILADCWSSDLSLGVPAEAPKTAAPAPNLAVRSPRKNP